MGWRLRGRNGAGFCNEIALSAGDPHVAQDGQFGFHLNAFGDHAGAAVVGNLQDRFEELKFDRVLVDVMHEMHVDFHKLRIDFRPQPQTGKALADVIDGDTCAEAAQLGERFVEVVKRGC